MRVFGYTEHEGCRLVVALSAAALLLALPVGSAWGQGYTDFGSGSPEPTHIEILELIYGGTWSADGPVDFSNDAGITVKRVYDTNGSMTLDILLGDESGVDQVWTDGQASVSARAKYASLNQSFGWNNNGGATGTIYTPLLTDADVGNGAVNVEITGDFLWGIKPNGVEWWSRISLNESPSPTDHLMTYFVEGLADLEINERAWLLFWEDLSGYDGGYDGDFNDFVVELRAVPEPGTLLLVGAGLAALGAFRQRRPRA